MMRIITGSAKGKKLTTLDGENTRPTSERIKGAIFSSIQFDVENRVVLDLFAGSGQMGLEAISRGAKSAMFVDAAREAIDVVKANAKSTGFFDDCRFLASDYRNYIRKAGGRESFDLVFIDPPYDLKCAVDALQRLVHEEMLIPGAIAVLESGEEIINNDLLTSLGFEIIKATNYGKKTAVTVLLFRGDAK